MKKRLVCLLCYFVLPNVVNGNRFSNVVDDIFIKKDLDDISNKTTIIAKLLRTVVPSPRAFQPSQEQIQQELADLMEIIGRQRLALIETNDYLQSKVGYNKDVNEKIRYLDGLLNSLAYDFTIVGFQRLKEKCQHADESPYSLFNQVRTMLLSVCHSDIIQAENEKIRKTVDNIHRQIAQYFPDSVEEQRIVNKMLSEELGEAEDPIFFLDSLLNDLLNNTSMLKGDFVAAVKKSRDNSGFRPGCILKSLGVELKYERFKLAREVNVFRHDLIKLVAEHTICLGALGSSDKTIDDEKKQLNDLVNKIEENALKYKELMLDRFWLHGISKVDYSDVTIDRGNLNKTATDLKINIERYGNAEIRYSVISYLNRPEQMGHPPSTFHLDCPPTRCYLETLGGVSFLVIRNPGSQDPKIYRRAREWYHRNEDDIRKRIDEKSTHYFAFSIVDNIESFVDLKSSPFAGTLLLRFYGFGKVELPTGTALANTNSVECVYYEWNTFFPKKDEVIKFFLIV